MNTRYWHDFVADCVGQVAALDGERDGILKAIKFALDVQEAWRWVYDLIVAFSPYMERRGHWEIWNPVLDRAILVARQVEDMAGAVNLSILSARLWQRQSQPQKTITCYRQAIRLARQIGDQYNEARACTNLGYLYIEQGQWQRAEILCCYALAIFEQLDSDHGRAHTENHLGLLYTRLGLWDQAGRHLEQACAIWQEMQDHHGLMYGFMNLGLLHVEMGQANKALAYSTEALHQANLTGEKLELGKIFMNVGLAYQIQGELGLAEKYTRRAETVFRRYFNLPGVVDTLENLGRIYLDQERWLQAIECLESALDARRSLGHKHDEIQVLIYLADSELSRGNPRQANLWINEAEHQLNQNPQAGRYYRLHAQLKELHTAARLS
jgi:tetratricopeptide (TPR) repeat protein